MPARLRPEPGVNINCHSSGHLDSAAYLIPDAVPFGSRRFPLRTLSAEVTADQGARTIANRSLKLSVCRLFYKLRQSMDNFPPEPATALFIRGFAVTLKRVLYLCNSACFSKTTGGITMIRQITVTFAALMLSGAMMSGCSTAINGATEDIRINIAGTGEALCDVTQPGHRYRVYAPSTFRAMRSKDDLRIRCTAPGNREQVVILRSELSDNLAYNVSNLGLGVGWDAMTGAMYNYPDQALIDFRGVPSTGYPQPDYQDVFDKNPELMQMEQFRPGNPALGSDMGTVTPTLQLRTGEEDNSMGIMMPVPGSTPGATSSSSPAKAPLPPILPPVAPAVAARPAIATPGSGGNSGASATTAGSSTTSTSTSQRIFTGKIGTVPRINP